MIRRRPLPSLAPCALALLALLAFGDARAQTITSIEDTDVGAPDYLRLHGTGFTDGAPNSKGLNFKVRLVSHADGKVYKAKFFGASDTGINARVHKTPPGDYTVRVSRKGVPDFEAPQTLTVHAPELLEISGDLAFGCGRTMLFGRYLGILPGKVRVGGKRAKVIGWQPVTEVDGEPSDDHHNITIIMPRGLGPGPHEVELSSLSGSGTLETLVVMQDTGLKCRLGGKSQMSARVDGDGLPKKLRSKGLLLVGWTDESLDDELTPDAAADADTAPEPFALSDAQLAAEVAGPLSRALAVASGGAEGTIEATTFLGTSRKGKAVRVIGLALPGWEPQVGEILQGDDAQAFDPVVVVIDLRIQNKQLVFEGSWGGPATEVEVAAHLLEPNPFSGRTHTRFTAETLELVEGTGAATISLTEALILNTREVSL